MDLSTRFESKITRKDGYRKDWSSSVEQVAIKPQFYPVLHNPGVKHRGYAGSKTVHLTWSNDPHLYRFPPWAHSQPLGTAASVGCRLNDIETWLFDSASRIIRRTPHATHILINGSYRAADSRLYDRKLEIERPAKMYSIEHVVLI
jgi:hypothetical protein